MDPGEAGALISAAEEVIFGTGWGTYFISGWISSPIVLLTHRYAALDDAIGICRAG